MDLAKLADAYAERLVNKKSDGIVYLDMADRAIMQVVQIEFAKLWGAIRAMESNQHAVATRGDAE